MKKIILLATSFFCCVNFINAQDGNPDQSFGKNGIVKTSFGDTLAYNSNAIQTDGKIVVAGYIWNGKNYDFLVARYNTDGSLDNTFDGDGKHKTDFGGTNDYAKSVAIQSDGKIVVAGSSDHRFALARYNTNGSLDKTFSNDGRQIDNFHGSGDEARSVTIQSDGKIVVAGVAKDAFAVARYTAGGSLDNTFSKDGLQTTVFADRFRHNEFANAAAIQTDGKIVVAGTAEDEFAIARYNTDGSADTTFSSDGKEKTQVSDVFAAAYSLAIQKDGKIAVEGEIASEETNAGFAIVRYSTNGSLDSTFNNNGIYEDFSFNFINSIAIQDDGKIVGGGSVQGSDFVTENFAIFRFTDNGKPDSSFGTNGVQVTEVNGAGFYGVASIAIANNEVYAVGTSLNSVFYGVVAAYYLNNSNNAPIVKISIPGDVYSYTAPARIKLNAVAYDVNGTIKKVEFYNGDSLIHTEYVFPYGYLWTNVPAGDYTLTAKAYDNDGFNTTSNTLHVSVATLPPVVKLLSPLNNSTYTAPASILLSANASDPDGKISRVEFHKYSYATHEETVVNTQYIYPYNYTLTNVPAGPYLFTAIAFDNTGVGSTSKSALVTVNESSISSRPLFENLKDAVSVKLSPNPANNIVNISAIGLQNKPATISIISISGIVCKTMQINSSPQAIPVDVSSLSGGTYVIKIASGNKLFYKQFVKL